MVLIMLLFIVGLVATVYLVHALDGNAVKIERDQKTAESLALAKAAIIGWAATRTTLTQLGQLPCPEDTTLIGLPTEGNAKSACTLPAVGRLPWRSLGLGELRDGNGDNLWYAISPGFRSTTINSDTPAQLTVDGVAGSAIAIVFSPGTILAGQTRPIPTIANPPDVTQYLDLSNNDGDSIFVTSGAAGSFNDRLLTISHNELFAVVEKRVASEVLKCLDVYASAPVAVPPPVPPTGAYPWPAMLDTVMPPTYVGTVNNFFGRVPDSPMGGNWSGACAIPVGGTGWWLNWKEMVFFALADGYKPTIATPGCGACLTVLPPTATADKRVVVLVAGQKLAGQMRSTPADKGTLSNYLETPNSTGGVSFAKQNMTSGFNDVVAYH
ncbi:MAG TPA: hypothetical protein PKW44_01815 [Methylophilaceae bacterium]|nr:hypothetical protein [Methylophilaceae bacterium]HQR60047.1 hypothetical protein [Methylophilaceae bacterium]